MVNALIVRKLFDDCLAASCDLLMILQILHNMAVVCAQKILRGFPKTPRKFQVNVRFLADVPVIHELQSCTPSCCAPAFALQG